MDSARQQLLRVNKYVWMCLAFVLAYLCLGQQQRPFDAPLAAVWMVFAVAVASVTTRTYLALRPGGGEAHWNRVFNYIDIVLLAVAIAATHGIDSHLWLIYFALMTFAALYANPVSKRAVDLSVSLFYTLATVPHQLHPQTALPPSVYLRTLGTHLFFLILVSALARRLSADAEERNRELLRLREQMASSDERARIAREVHDSLGHTMVSTLLRLELCYKLMDRNAPEAKEILEEEIPALRAAWSEARDLAFHLRPWDADIAADGLVAALRTRCRKFAERTGIVVQMLAADEGCALRPDAAFALIRIVQETLTNAAKHAEATRIDVSLSAIHDGRIVCEICDNGKGFDDRQDGAGVGLAAMRERAGSLGGTLVISSAPDCGATVVVEIPV